MSKSEDKKQREAELMQFIQEYALDEEQKQTESFNHKQSVNLGREYLYLKYFEEIVNKVFKNKIVPSKYALKNHKTSKSRIVNLILSDLHFGADLDGAEVPLKYGPTEESRRFAAIIAQTAEYKPQYREESILYIHLLGDVIQGQILHDPRDGHPLAKQMAAALYYLVQGINFLSQHFPKIVIRCCSGNHGRNALRHKERAVHQRWDSFETSIYHSLKIATSNLPNVSVEIPLTPYYSYQAFNNNGFAWHGDTIIKTPSPGTTINVANIRKQINEINAKLNHDERYRLFMCGHIHTGSVVYLPTGTVLLTNGALVPVDSYGLSIGITDCTCGQLLFESVEDHIVGDLRFLKVDEYTDKDASLEKIIKPFINF